MVRTCRLAVAILFLTSILSAWGSATTKVPDLIISLNSTQQSPQFLGSGILWYASLQNQQQGHVYDYRFTVALGNQSQIVRDYQNDNSFFWAPWKVEGTYTVTVSVRDVTSQPYITYPDVSQQFVINPWVTQQGGSAVHSTSHPLVALFSGPPCKAGDFILVRFTQVGSNVSTVTNSQPCAQTSANFLIAGMYPSTQYKMHWEEISSSFGQKGQDLTFTTGPLSADYPPTQFQVNVPPDKDDAQFPMILFQFLPTNQPHWPTATDLMGNPLWYFPNQLFVTRIGPGGEVYAFPDDSSFAVYDLAGVKVLQTNVARINEQLAAKGFRALDDFNTHETRRLPNGDFLVLGSSHIVSTMYQGGTQQNPVCILGDLILVLDHNMQLKWAWDAFQHQDLNRYATQHEVCTHGAGGCPKFPNNFTQANDWLHTNAAQLTADGSIMISERHQDWVLKINYQNGQGDGSILWKMGPFGDFTITNPPPTQCGDPAVFPWFTHQHDSAFQAQTTGAQLGQGIFTVFDDGNLRHAQCGGVGNSRGIMLTVNERAKTVTIVTEADLGGYSAALGSAELLLASDGIFPGYNNPALGSPQSPMSTSNRLDISGKIRYQIQANSWSYRTYRRRDIYTPTLP